MLRVFLAAALIVAPSLASAEEFPRWSLEAMHGVDEVSVALLTTTEVERIGVNREALVNDAKRRLRAAGIGILPDPFTLRTTRLRITIGALTDDKADFASFYVALQALQDARLLRDESIYMLMAPVWEGTAMLGLANPISAAPAGIQQKLEELVNDFLNLYVTANPRKP